MTTPLKVHVVDDSMKPIRLFISIFWNLDVVHFIPINCGFSIIMAFFFKLETFHKFSKKSTMDFQARGEKIFQAKARRLRLEIFSDQEPENPFLIKPTFSNSIPCLYTK